MHFQLYNSRGVATFFCVPGRKFDEKSIENSLDDQKILVKCLFWGGCQHPNIWFGLYNDVALAHFMLRLFKVDIRLDARIVKDIS